MGAYLRVCTYWMGCHFDNHVSMVGALFMRRLFDGDAYLREALNRCIMVLFRIELFFLPTLPKRDFIPFFKLFDSTFEMTLQTLWLKLIIFLWPS